MTKSLRALVRKIRSENARYAKEPWADVHLTKAERKGKTPEEIATMRKIKWGRDETNAPKQEDK